MIDFVLIQPYVPICQEVMITIHLVINYCQFEKSEYLELSPTQNQKLLVDTGTSHFYCNTTTIKYHMEISCGEGEWFPGRIMIPGQGILVLMSSM